MDTTVSSLIASSASFTLRSQDRSCVRKAFFAYCWVMVEPPWVDSPVTLFHTARPMPTGEIPPCS